MGGENQSNEEDSDLETAFCPRCDDTVPIKQTVPWQPDICRTCGADVPGPGS